MTCYPTALRVIVWSVLKRARFSTAVTPMLGVPSRNLSPFLFQFPVQRRRADAQAFGGLGAVAA
jgi:hypothetical protein